MEVSNLLPFATKIKSYEASAILLSCLGFDVEVRPLLTLLSKRTGKYLK